MRVAGLQTQRMHRQTIKPCCYWAFFNPPGPLATYTRRCRISLAHGEPKYDHLEKRLAPTRVMTVPRIALEPVAHGATYPEPASCGEKLTGECAHRTAGFSSRWQRGLRRIPRFLAHGGGKQVAKTHPSRKISGK